MTTRRTEKTKLRLTPKEPKGTPGSVEAMQHSAEGQAQVQCSDTMLGVRRFGGVPCAGPQDRQRRRRSVPKSHHTYQHDKPLENKHERHTGNQRNSSEGGQTPRCCTEARGTPACLSGTSFTMIGTTRWIALDSFAADVARKPDRIPRAQVDGHAATKVGASVGGGLGWFITFIWRTLLIERTNSSHHECPISLTHRRSGGIRPRHAGCSGNPMGAPRIVFSFLGKAAVVPVSATTGALAQTVPKTGAVLQQGLHARRASTTCVFAQTVPTTVWRFRRCSSRARLLTHLS